MSEPPPERLKLFVYVVESPSAPDIYHQRSECDLLRRAVTLNQMPCVARCAISKVAFSAALTVGLKEEMDRFPGYLPIVHISAHGNSDGLQLSTEEVLTWSELGDMLTPINKALKNVLVVAMSCCEGYSGIRMAMRPDGSDLPFFALVGSPEKPTWSETAVGFATFYHQLLRGAHINYAVTAMRIASGRESFFVEWGENTRQEFIEHLKRVDAGQAKDEIRNIAEAQPASDLAKMIQLEEPEANRVAGGN